MFPSSLRFILVFAALLPAGTAIAAADDDTIRIDVLSDLTDAGEKVVRATPAKPVYYLPSTLGYSHSGLTLTGEAPPPPTPLVQHLLAQALASQGYHFLRPKSPPSVILLLAWGYMAPNIGSASDNYQFYNEAEMENLVIGINLVISSGRDRSLHEDALMAAAKTNRYYVTVTALDYAATKQKKVVPLWYAHASTERDGHSLNEVLPSLISALAPVLGAQAAPEFIEAVPMPLRSAAAPAPAKAP